MTGPVVVTGMGTVGPHGAGADALAGALAEGRPLLREVDRGSGLHRRASARHAALVGSVDLSAWIHKGRVRRMCPASRMAVAAGRMALHEAGMTSGPEDPATSVCLATTFGASSVTEKLLDQIFLEGPEAVSPFLFTESVANAPSAQVALMAGARGPNGTVVQREAGALLAVSRGWKDVGSGRSARSLVGSVDEITPLTHAVLDRYGALCRPRPGKEERPRPFDRGRDGFLAGEGATVLLLEREAAARQRGARPLARLRASVAANDPTAPPTGWGRDPAPLARSLARGLERADVTLSSIDAVVSGASGSREGDRLEALVLRELWRGETLPPVITPKAVHGEYGGGFLASAVLVARGGLHVSASYFGEEDSELRIRPHDGEVPAGTRRLLCSTLAAGGAAAWLVLEAP